MIARLLFMPLAMLLAFEVHAEGRTLAMCYDKYPPYAIGEFGAVTESGIKVRLLQEIAKQLGLVVVVRILPWGRCQAEAKEGRLDGILPLYKTPEREQYLEFSAPVMKQYNCFLYKKSAFHGDVDWKNYDKLKKHRLGMEIGSVVDKAMEAAFASSHPIERAADSVALIKMIDSGRIDLATIDSNVGRYLVDQQGVGETIGVSNVPIGQLSYASFGLSKASGAARWIPEFNKAIEKMRASGQLEKIVNAAGE
ncbi:substrate-binding periplasmic protein [Chromobacterium sphagni]|uniref:Solute-binding protein family 3/N-terminal domain-containing protein n=1 Tax=Chromobacterium sphagni TaxID=1903179 RepID=A0A1S1WT11_9NEIS|nr:transporter substrate-binding domain-containing protein [Chromobacterium sphagni]OHX10366.1 hypothetical protein BI347_21505 [Chromobacterium sphagni]OHX17129.1 hypothetical protein BI344_21060 [Chromobacterium sphagni]